MTTYAATIRHHSISHAREIEVEGTLTKAKQAATREFGDGFLDHEIVIFEISGPYQEEIVSSRRIGDRKWIDRD